MDNKPRARKKGGAEQTEYLSAKNLSPFIGKDLLDAPTITIQYQTKTGEKATWN